MMNDYPMPAFVPDIWQARTYDDYFPKAKTLPLVVTCARRRADGQSEEKQFVTKAIGHPEISDTDLFAEIFGNLLARMFGLTTCEPHIIAFTEDFVAATAGITPPKVNLRIGYGVGSLFDPPLIPVIADFKIPKHLLAQATLLYAFDLLTVNPDRKRSNSNCALQGDKLVAFDFNEAFRFLNANFKPPSWMVADNGIASSHICRANLRQSQTHWDEFIAALRTISAPALAALVKDFPAAWQVHLTEVTDHLLLAQSKRKPLELQLQKSLTI